MSAPIRIIAMVVVTALFVWVFFSLAGRWDWMRGWTYIGILIAGNAINELVLWFRNPELFRLRGRTGEGTKTWDKVCLALFGLTVMLILIVGALDAGRYQWSVMPFWLWPFGVALYAGGQALLIWSMVVNPFFEKTARIQKDRDHRVVDGGPYALVRHPGYVGIILGFVLGSPLMLGSWWAFVPAAISALSLVVRTALEDRMLRAGLEGYKAYATRVRYRLIPYFW
ncbi:MAG: isoprenylcysteine carboxylmethyltransferase family protein [Rhodospirillales bacterium]|nr:isoprenylcysteine carboxylmethyltransferase family protein [Rhodospirillales bacterium]